MRSRFRSLGGGGWACFPFSSARLAARKSPLILRVVRRRSDRGLLRLLMFVVVAVGLVLGTLLARLGLRIGLLRSGDCCSLSVDWLYGRLADLAIASPFRGEGRSGRPNAIVLLLFMDFPAGVGVSGRGSTCSGFISNRGIPRLESTVLCSTRPSGSFSVVVSTGVRGGEGAPTGDRGPGAGGGGVLGPSSNEHDRGVCSCRPYMIVGLRRSSLDRLSSRCPVREDLTRTEDCSCRGTGAYKGTSWPELCLDSSPASSKFVSIPIARDAFFDPSEIIETL